MGVRSTHRRVLSSPAVAKEGEAGSRARPETAAEWPCVTTIVLRVPSRRSKQMMSLRDVPTASTCSRNTNIQKVRHELGMAAYVA